MSKDENSNEKTYSLDSSYINFFKNYNSIMLLIDPEKGVIVEANSAACDFYGYNYTDILNMNTNQIIMLTQEEMLEEMERAKNENRKQFYSKHRLANGEIRDVEIYRGSIVVNHKVLLYSTVNDITDRRKAEEEVIELNRSLENKVIERTLQLEEANRLLEKSNTLLEETNASLEEEISERMKAEDSLNKSMLEIRDLYDNVPCGYHSLDENGTIIRMNNTELNWLGFTRDEIIGKKKYKEFMTIDSKAKFEKRYTEFLQRGWAKDLEMDIINKDGNILSVLISGTAMRDENGKFIMSRTTVYDNSLRKLAEDKLQQLNKDLEEIIIERTYNLEEANAELEEEIAERINVENDLANKNQIMDTLLENISVGVAMVEAPSGKAVFTNEYAKKLLGWDIVLDVSKESLSKALHIYKLGTNEPYPDEEMPIIRGMYGESCYVDDMVVIHPDGKKVLLEVFGTPVTDSSGKVIASLVSFADISQRKQAEDDIKKLNRELLRINSELEETNALLEEEIQESHDFQIELIKAKEEAENANAAKSNFLANMSHEIRTPMNGIIGMTELTIMTDLNVEQFSYLKLVKKSANSLLRIINDVLDYTKIEAGKISVENKPFVLRDAINEIITLFDINAKQKGLKVTLNIEEKIPHILYGDNVRLKQILGNLIGNAVKFTEHGGIDIFINIKSLEGNTIKLEFVFKDTGIGIPEDKKEQLFQRFTQLDSSYTKQYQGTGLGLAISKKLVELMSGEIWIESNMEVGSTFCFTAVFGVDIGMNEAAITETFENDMKSNLARENKVLLVVEDDEVSRQVIVTFLKTKKIKTLIAENGKLAVDIFKDSHVDMILMDVQMPILDGLSATKEIRILEHEKNKHVPIIAMTAYALAGDKASFLEIGMDDYVSKPINFNEVYEIIEKYLGK